MLKVAYLFQGQSRPLFFFKFAISLQLTFNINFANDWNQTTDLEIVSDRSTSRATTTALVSLSLIKSQHFPLSRMSHRSVTKYLRQGDLINRTTSAIVLLFVFKCDTLTVWPDWAIFKISLWHIFLKRNLWWPHFGLEWKPHFKVKIAVATIGVTFWKIWATFYFNIWSHCTLTDGCSTNSCT